MKIAILFAGALFATHALSADFELSSDLLDTVSAGNSSCCYELLDSVDPNDIHNSEPASVTLPALPSHIDTGTQSGQAPANDLEAVSVALPALPAHIRLRTPRDPAPTENLAETVSRPALELLQRDSNAWQNSLEDPITVERLAQPQRSSTFALQQLLSAQ